MADAKETTSNILDFLMLVGRLKHLRRTGWVLRKVKNCESIAGHMYRMSIMAFLLEDGACGLIRDRCIKMALIHDISECIVGDLTPFCGVSKEEKHKREMEAMNKLCSLIPKNISEEIFNLYKEYTEQVTVDAKAVKDLDKLDMLMQAYEYELEAESPLFLQDFFDNTKGIQNSTVLNWFQELLLYRDRNCEHSSTTDLTRSNTFEFFLLLGKLKHLKRTFWGSQNIPECETVADHMYRTSIMAFILDDGTSIGLNKDKCIKLALIKNIADSIKVNITECEKDPTYMEVMERVCKLAGEKFNKEIFDLYKEYQTQQSPEAKTVKDLEEFEYLLQAYEYEKGSGSTLATSLADIEHFDFENSEVSKWHKELLALQNRKLQLNSK
ncbi:hypothetical protein JTE90_013141 [Oedothorax gibbosus]|uniref:5'-deoxynucleotidase HDDC2 n=1 Tax=Oedothorax gibbosus TaxID=931172 RepID=A0AAV6VME8_9ARAC|nr:hypothetical protein JTE90_013141 [Oedothorax gibbosus]